MRISVLVKLIAVLVWFGSFAACTQNASDTELFVQNLMETSKALKAGEILNMDEVNRGKWDRMFVFTPYTPLSDIEAAIKSKPTEPIIESRISERDDANLLVFMSKSVIQLVAVVGRDNVDFSLPQNVHPISRQSAGFKRRNQGGPLVWVNESQ